MVKLFVLALILNFNFEVRAKNLNASQASKNANKKRAVFQQRGFSIKEFEDLTGFKPGEYFEVEDNEDCLSGDVRLLTSDEGLLTLKVGDKILITGIGRDQIVSDYSERECKITNTTKILDSKLFSVLEAKCTAGLDKKISTQVTFSTDLKTRKPLITYTQKRQIPKQKDNTLTCKLVGV